MVQTVALKYRIDTTILPQTPLCHADDLQHQHLLPDLEDKHNVESLMVKEVMEVWRCYSDDLSWIEPDRFTHRYSRNFRNKSEFVSILYLLSKWIVWTWTWLLVNVLKSTHLPALLHCLYLHSVSLAMLVLYLLFDGVYKVTSFDVSHEPIM